MFNVLTQAAIQVLFLNKIHSEVRKASSFRKFKILDQKLSIRLESAFSGHNRDTSRFDSDTVLKRLQHIDRQIIRLLFKKVSLFIFQATCRHLWVTTSSATRGEARRARGSTSR